MRERSIAGPKGTNSVKEFAEEELRLRDKTLSRTARDTDRDTRSFDPVLAPVRGGMTSTRDEGAMRIAPPSGRNIDAETLALRDRTLANTPPDTDPKSKSIRQVTAPEKGGMR